jgi:tetratricopeptide (TPR) repeat protein
MVLAYFYFEQKNYNEAKNIYENLSKVYTNNIDIYNNLGITYFQLKDYEKAKNAFLEVLKIDPTNASAQKSIQVISKIIRKPIELPKIPLDKEIEYYMKEGIFYYNQKDYEKAEEYFRKVIKLNNNSAEGYNNLGIVLYMKNKKEEAISMLKKALIINPKYSEAYRNLFYILKDLGRVNEAKEVIITGIRHLPNDESLKRILEELK